MTQETQRIEETAQNATERIAALTNLFQQMRQYAEASLFLLGEPGPAIPKSLLSKMGEMQSAHFALLRAEEAFHEKVKSGTAIAEVDFDALRLDVGCQLDRIRAAIAQTSVHDATDTD